jgi:hypothetical protein
MSKQQKLWSVNRLSAELQRNPRTLAKALADVPADGTLAGRPAWRMSTAIETLRRYEGGSNRFDGRQSAAVPDTLDAIDHAAASVQDLLDRMRSETDVDRRRAILRADGRCVGVLHRAFEADLAGCGPPEVEMYSPWVRDQFHQIMTETMELCEMRYGDDVGGDHE